MIDQSTLQNQITTIAEQRPLINSITNFVTIDEVANITSFWGGLPSMSQDQKDIEERFRISDGCHLNMGFIDDKDIELFIEAGKAANNGDTPVAFDPVGAGGTSERTEAAREIGNEIDVSIICGNYGEITALVQDDANIRGVDVTGEHADIEQTAVACANTMDSIVVATGETDIIADQTTAYKLSVGDSMLGSFVGTGCMLGITVNIFDAVAEDSLSAALGGTTAFGIAGEIATKEQDWQGPASYRTAFLDTVASLNPETFETIDVEGRIETVDVR